MVKIALQKCQFPVVALERETGDLSLLRNPEEVELFVWEFADIFNDDFAMWDSRGREFDVAYTPENDIRVDLRSDPSSAARLRAALESFLADQGASSEGTSELRRMADALMIPE